jgi:hypothetical protein
MNVPPPPPERSNTLGKASLVLGITSLISIFFVGSCVNVVKSQGGNVSNVKPVVELFGGTFALVGLIAAGLGLVGLFGSNHSKVTAIVGLVLGIASLGLAAAVAKMLK